MNPNDFIDLHTFFFLFCYHGVDICGFMQIVFVDPALFDIANYSNQFQFVCDQIPAKLIPISLSGCTWCFVLIDLC